MNPQVHILHTNDFHSHLDEQKSRRILALRLHHPAAILVDAGDAVSAGNIGVRPGGEPILELMTELGYAAMTLGNREFHVADLLLRAKIGKAGFPVLCANMRWKEDRNTALPVQSNVVLDVTGVRVGIFGVTVPMVTERMAARALSAFLFDDPVKSARAQIEQLRGKVDLLIALTHIGLREDERLAKSCPELDLIIGGHSHNVLQEPNRVGDVPIVQAGWFGHYIGCVSLQTSDTGGRANVDARLFSLRD